MNNQRGAILLITFSVISSLLIIGAGFSFFMINERLASERYLRNTQAVFVAQAGLEKAIYDLRQDYKTTSSWADGNINGTVVVPRSGEFYELYSVVNFGCGKYTVEIKNDGSSVDRVWIKSTGIVKNNRQSMSIYVLVHDPAIPVLKVLGLKNI